MNEKLILTTKEIEEIEILKEGAIEMSVNGTEVICFDLIFDIFTDKRDIKAISREELLQSYKQFKSSIKFWETIPFIDNSILYKIERKIRTVFMNEIESRK